MPACAAKATLWWFRVLILCIWHVDHVLPSPHRAIKLGEGATDILYIEDGYPEHRTYKLEDFFWTGSGDGAPDHPWEDHDKTSTIYRTKTVMSTVYISVSNENQSNTETDTPCAINCETVIPVSGTIKPTPTFENHTIFPPLTTGNASNATSDRHFWLLTVIKTDGKEPVVAVLEKRLAKLYSVAFRRQQQRHLGITKRPKRQLPNGANGSKFAPENKPVNVCIHTLEKNEDKNEVEVLYHVLVSGQPVQAVAAASDMRLVTDEEVATELGFPIRMKAEPFLKVEKPQSLARIRDTWLFIGAALAAIFLLVLMVTIFTFCLNKRKRTLITRPTGIVNRQHIFDRETGGQVNVAYNDNNGDNLKNYQSGRRHHRRSPARPRNTTSNETITSHFPEVRPLSTHSNSTTSTTSSDISPMIPPKHRSSSNRKQSRNIDKKPSAINKILLQKQATVCVDTDSSSGSQVTLVKDEARGRVSPKSYLSMPSVKSFPRSSIPETLNKVLEPVSVLHLDMTDDVIPEPSPIYRPVSGKKFIRHGSLGCEDPGVIGPVVWDLHCKRLQNGERNEDLKSENHANKMRKRFHELLDDTFSLFGTSKDSQIEPNGYATSNSSVRNFEPRGHSAVVRPSTGSSSTSKQRPKTGDPRRIAPSPGLEPPRGAWSSATPSPLIRPLSAGPFHRPSLAPTVEVERILADGSLPETDPAVPLIAAIKTELEKCSLPGSTTNLVE